LHSIHKSLHRDLKSPNILITSKRAQYDIGDMPRAKIADFGFSEIVNKGKKKRRKMQQYHSTVQQKDHHAEASNRLKVKHHKRSSDKRVNWTKKMRGFVGTVQWMAPEMMADQATYGPPVDIYSFAVVMWEILACSQPWRSRENDTVIRSVKSGERPNMPNRSAPTGYTELLVACWDQADGKRPCSNDVQGAIHDMFVAYAQDSQDTSGVEGMKSQLLATNGHSKNVDAGEALPKDSSAAAVELVVHTK